MVEFAIISGAVCGFFHTSMHAIARRNRMRDVVFPKQVLAYFLSKYTKIHPTRVGAFLGGFERTTVMHSASLIAGLAKTDKTVREQIEIIDEIVQIRFAPYKNNDQ